MAILKDITDLLGYLHIVHFYHLCAKGKPFMVKSWGNEMPL